MSALHSEFCGALENMRAMIFENNPEVDEIAVHRLEVKLLLMFSAVRYGDKKLDWEQMYRRGETSPIMHDTLFIEELKGLDQSNWQAPVPA
jgi:hypothetical protein